jgi:hypothetical protein
MIENIEIVTIKLNTLWIMMDEKMFFFVR